MKKSQRTRRMGRHHDRMHKTSKLNLVSLMDIFTILVFFLLVNSSDVEVLQNNKTIELPTSLADQKPDENLVAILSSENLVVGGRQIANVSDIVKTEGSISELAKELQYQISKRPVLTDAEMEKGRAITIMGDKGIPYTLLKRVMVTCAENDFRDISLAVSQSDGKDRESGAAGG